MSRSFCLVYILALVSVSCRQESVVPTDTRYTYRITDLKDINLEESYSGQTIKIFAAPFNDFNPDMLPPAEARVYFDQQASPILRYGRGYIITRVPRMN